MIYKPFQDISLSALGFGAMRLPTVQDGGSRVDVAEAERLVRYAYEQGVNYFDTAYSYHEGQSESIMGGILKQFPRDRYYLASKFPGHEIRPSFDVKAIFEEQLSRCGVDYFDFYLLHNVYENSIKVYLDPQWGIIDYLMEQKTAGRIRHLGFSSHGRAETMKQFLDLHGDKMEFCQIQLNYLDWSLQDGQGKYQLLADYGIPVWVMEPARGGSLAKLAPEMEEKLKAARPGESVCAWAFRWLQGLPNVAVVLSGMTTMAQLEDNIKTFSDERLLSDEEMRLIDEAILGLMDLLPCTGCRYCCSGCPQKLDIPLLLSYYNDCRFEPSLIASMAVDAMEPKRRPDTCIGCGACSQACPQGIDIPRALKDFQSILDTIPHWGS